MQSTLYTHLKDLCMICNYSSGKLELLVLKWVVIENICDYLLGLCFQGYMDNNQLIYVQDSPHGALQIWWLSELAFSILLWITKEAISTGPQTH